MIYAHRTPLLVECYHRYLADQDPCIYATAVAQRYSLGTLERMLVSSDRLGRRAAALAISMLGDFEANASLGMALNDPDRGVRTLAENGIRALWCRVGEEAERQALSQIIRQNQAQRFHEVIVAATALIQTNPAIAETWNQRAIAFFRTERFTESIRDCAQALELNPYHFGAAAGMGQCYLQMGNRAAALECFQRAIRLNPALEGVRMQAHYLQRTRNRTEGNSDRP